MRLLIVGSPSSALSSAAQMAMRAGARVAMASSPDQALASLRSGQSADLAMVDVAFDIAGFIQNLDAERMALTVVACGVNTDPDLAVAAIEAGAKEFVPLPPQADLIAAILEAVCEENADLIAADPNMKRVVALADQIAPSEASVLITGESGVGKEVIAKHIHSHSKRAEKPFISINCAAIPENLLESELFGHEKGAFTGAIARRIGKFEEAHGGTLLLDEISEMDIRLQAKLLRVLQERIVDRVGGTKPIPVDIRVLATSNRDLEEEVRNGRFREDLLFRLNVVNLKVPPLRERPSDILVLARHFVRKYAETNGVSERPLSEGAQRALVSAAWPGNVRALENAIHRAVLLAEGQEIEAEDICLPDGRSLSPQIGTGKQGGEPGDFVGRKVADVERELIINTLDHCFGNRTHAANILGISIRTLRNKLRQYTDEGIPVPQPGDSKAMG